MHIPTHADMVNTIRGKGGRTRRRIGNNLWGAIADDGSITITLHSTIIVTMYSDGSAVVNSGGYRTHTTKKRINQYSPIRVYQKNFEWYFENGMPFEDGAIVSNNWIVCPV